MLVGVLWIAGCTWYAFSVTPYLQLTYEVRWPDAAPVLVDACSGNAAREHITRNAANGSTVYVDLCFTAAKADSDRRFMSDDELLARKFGGAVEGAYGYEWLIPYALAEGGKARMAGARYKAVREYTAGVASWFVLDEHGVEQARRVAIVEQLKRTFLTVFGGLAFGWVFVAVTGWIVRGFLGVPRGEDRRPPE